ncbi:hypothetical protein [Dyella mobilis]|uniref:Uncharacterized protein n=1 Tax=Dyella mobilis TaxID=1849582 RepID=A0ABS2KCB2_9GAMM|nr:hypothetical protein [Dyella mobilis]MBM7128811.1 hypothetical protein [Dyella mobilis]GLQ99143.1 hypothetical protein GCM10007863_35630 [Dyella mobilis]
MRTSVRLSCIAVTAAMTVAVAHAKAAAADPSMYDSGPFFTPHPTVGLQLGNVFSIADSIKGDGLDEQVLRMSGTSLYKVSAVAPGKIELLYAERYDGHSPRTGRSEIRDDGKTLCANGKCRTYTDASGVAFNALLWGTPPATIRVGTTWNVDIPQPWEMGPAAQQKITVISIDPVAHEVTVLREGSGTGFAANETPANQIQRGGKTYSVDLTPGPARWKGYTTFKNGFVESDELVMVRPVIMVSKELGTLHASERTYMLLNAMPADSLSDADVKLPPS